jgi:predicted RNA binding protein YcfA (HicA-like mRNA interferase family)
MAQVVAVRLVRALLRLGWAIERQGGSHIVLVKPGRTPVSVPMVATIERALVGISQTHKLQGFPSPRNDAHFTEVLQGIRRTLGVAPPAKRPVLIDTRRALFEPMEHDTTKSVSLFSALARAVALGTRSHHPGKQGRSARVRGHFARRRMLPIDELTRWRVIEGDTMAATKTAKLTKSQVILALSEQTELSRKDVARVFEALSALVAKTKKTSDASRAALLSGVVGGEDVREVGVGLLQRRLPRLVAHVDRHERDDGTCGVTCQSRFSGSAPNM